MQESGADTAYVLRVERQNSVPEAGLELVYIRCRTDENANTQMTSEPLIMSALLSPPDRTRETADLVCRIGVLCRGYTTEFLVRGSDARFLADRQIILYKEIEKNEHAHFVRFLWTRF